MKLIVGLGNPGGEYAGNRHNIGAICLLHLARQHRIPLDRRLGHARCGFGELAGEKVVLAKPQVFMNLSGRSVRVTSQKFALEACDIVIIHDDLDLPLGKMRIRQGGGSAGHKGVNSIISELGSADFVRIRIGIGHPSLREDSEGVSESEIVEYVLSDFSPEEKAAMEKVIPLVSEAIFYLITYGITLAMNKYN